MNNNSIEMPLGKTNNQKSNIQTGNTIHFLGYDFNVPKNGKINLSEVKDILGNKIFSMFEKWYNDTHVSDVDDRDFVYAWTFKEFIEFYNIVENQSRF